MRLQSNVVDVRTRQLQAFLALAEDLNFTRAAQRLYLSQQALSVQVQRLEAALGAKLFTRTTREVQLTKAGELLLPHATAALAALDQASEELDMLTRGVTKLRLGFVAGGAVELTTPILAELGVRAPTIEIEVRSFGFRDPSAGLHSRLVDAAFIRLPLTTTGLQVEPLFTEPRVVAMSASNALARKQSVTLDDIRSEPLIAARTNDPVWNDFWLAMDCRDDTERPEVLTAVRSLEEELTLLSTGRAISITALSSSRHLPRPGVVFRPITDIPGSTLALAWPKDAANPAVRTFVETALAVRDRETELLSRLSSAADE